jgi:hypothetical protein
MAHGDHPKTLKEEIDSRALKILKEKSMDPKTGFPRTVDPGLFKGKVGLSNCKRDSCSIGPGALFL